MSWQSAPVSGRVHVSARLRFKRADGSVIEETTLAGSAPLPAPARGAAPQPPAPPEATDGTAV